MIISLSLSLSLSLCVCVSVMRVIYELFKESFNPSVNLPFLYPYVFMDLSRHNYVLFIVILV